MNIYKILTKTSELLNDSGYLTELNHNEAKLIQGGTTGQYYHLTSAEHAELTEWLDDVTLGSDGALTLPNVNYALTIENRIRFNSTSGSYTRIEWYDGTSTWDTNLYRSAANTLKTDDSFYISGDLTVAGADITGANNTGIVLGGVSAGQIRLTAATGVYSSLVLASGSIGPTIMRFKDAPTNVEMVPQGGYNITMYESSSEGTAKPLMIYGYPTGAGEILYGKFEAYRDTKNYFKLSTNAAGGFNFDDDDILTTGSITGGSMAIGTDSVLPAIDEDTFASNLDTKVPTQQSVKAYVDASEDKRDRLVIWSDNLNNDRDAFFSNGGTDGAVVASTSLPSSNHPGVVALYTTANNGYARRTTDVCIVPGGGVLTLEMCINLYQASDADNDYHLAWGLLDTINHADQANGIYFRYNHGQSSGDLELVTALSPNKNTQDSGQAAPTTNEWHTYKIVTNADWTSVSFYYDGTLLGTSTTYLPTTRLGFGMVMKSNVRTSTKYVYMDWQYLNQVFTTART